jgi:hypothetical protein
VTLDKAFCTYVDKIELEHFDGQSLTPNQLMGLMSQKYKQLMVQGKWDTPSTEDLKLMAMQAKIDTLSRGRKGGGKTAAKNEGGRSSPKRR